MQFILSTGTLYTYGLERVFEIGARAGFDGMEVLIDERWDTRQPDYLRALMDRSGLSIMAVHSPFKPAIPGWPSGEPALMRKAVEVADAVGAGVVVHHLPLRIGFVTVQAGPKRVRVPFFDVGGKNAEYVSWIENGGYAALQAEADALLCIENMPSKRWFGKLWNIFHWNTPGEMAARFENITLDTTHLGTWNMDPARVYGVLGRRVKHIHLSNFDGIEHRLPLAGELALDDLLRAMNAGGYDRTICFELDPSALQSEGPDSAIIDQLASNLETCREWAGVEKRQPVMA